jgi:hypothetical protein
MKKVFCFCLLALLSFSAIFPTYAQKSRIRPKNDIRNPSTEFAGARAFSDGEGVFVEWEMKVEVNNGGFYVYRIDENGTRQISPAIIKGSEMTRYETTPAYGEKYTFFDVDGGSNSSYFIESIQMDGTTVATKAFIPTRIADLKAVTGFSSNELSVKLREKMDSGSLISNELVLTKEVAAEVRANQAESDSSTHRWVISQPGVKIAVRKEGLYRVTRDQLQAGGFNVNSDPNLWQVYAEGVEQAIIVGPNAGYIEFYGKGVDTVESDTAIYYLLTGPAAGKRIQTRGARPSSGTVVSRSYQQTFVQKERINYIHQVLNGDAENYWGDGITNLGDTTVTFALSGIDFSKPDATMELKFQGFSFDSHTVRVILNGETLSSATGNSRNPFSRQYVIPTSFLREGSNTLQFRALGATGGFTFFDSVSIDFARKYLAIQNRLEFLTQNYRVTRVEGFSSQNIRVFDKTTEGSPVLLSGLNVVQEGATFGVRLLAARGRLLYAVEDSGIMQASSVTVNDPELLSNPLNGGKLVIISYKDWIPQAEVWANYRRAQGITVEVVDVSEIYDEFNFGVLSSNSVESFLRYASENWQIPPEYVFLLGDATYDPRNYEGVGFFNFVPTRIVNTVYIETGSDDSLADFNDDGLSEMAVGRIAARNAQTVTNALAKVTTFEQSLSNPLGRGALFAYDVFDSANNYNFQLISSRLRSQLPASMPVTMVGRGDTPAAPDTPQTLLVNAINSGKYVVNYTGHGTAGAWASSNFFANSTVPQLTNASNPSIFTMLTCLNGYFITLNGKSLAENLVESTNGGAVAAWASSGETTPDIQEIMATRFFLKLGEGSIPRIGDLIRDAKATIPGGTDVRNSWVLLGDPTQKVR